MSRMYNQVRRVEIAYDTTSTQINKTEQSNDTKAIIIDYDNLDIDFNISFQNSKNINTCNLTLYNLSHDTLSKIKAEDAIRIKAGYEEFNGYIFTGKIDYVSTNKTNLDVETKIICTPDSSSWNMAFISQSWARNTLATTIVKQIIELANWQVGHLEVKDIKYQGGKVFRNNARFCLEEIAEDTNSLLYFNNGLVYMYPKDKTFKKTITLKPTDGLIETPVVTVNKSTKITSYKIKTALRYDYQSDTILKIEDSDYISAVDLKIIQGKHVASDSDFFSELDCQKVEEITQNKDSDYIDQE